MLRGIRIRRPWKTRNRRRPVPHDLLRPLIHPPGTPASFECYRDDKGEDCCARGVNLKYCSGEFPLFGCYLVGLENCCDNGEICYGEECCQASWSAAPVEGNSASVTEAPTRSGTQTTTKHPATGTEDERTTTTAPMSTGGAAEAVLAGMAPFAAGVFGLAAWL